MRRSEAVRIGNIVGVVVAEPRLHERVQLLVVLARRYKFGVLGMVGDMRETIGNIVELVELDAVCLVGHRVAVAVVFLRRRFLGDRQFVPSLEGKQARLPHDALSSGGRGGDCRRDALERHLMAQLPLPRPVDKGMRAIVRLVVVVDGDVRHAGRLDVLEVSRIARKIRRADGGERGDAGKTGCTVHTVQVVEREVIHAGLGAKLLIGNVAKLIGTPAFRNRALRTFGERRGTEVARWRVERNKVDDSDGDLDGDVSRKRPADRDLDSVRDLEVTSARDCQGVRLHICGQLGFYGSGQGRE